MSVGRRGACEQGEVGKAGPRTCRSYDCIDTQIYQRDRYLGYRVSRLNGEVGCCTQAAVVMRDAVGMAMGEGKCSAQKHERNA